MAIRDLVPWRERTAFPPSSRDVSFAALRREMDALLHDFWGGSGARFLDHADRPFPVVNVSENPEAWRVTAELPGLEAKDVQVSYEGNLLLLTGIKGDEREEKGRTWYRRERWNGTFERAIELPAAVDATRATAAFANGVLTIDVPKKPDAKVQRHAIAVK